MKYKELVKDVDFSKPCRVDEIYDIHFLFTDGKYNTRYCENIIAGDTESSTGYQLPGGEDVYGLEQEKYDRGITKTYNRNIEDIDWNDEDVKYIELIDSSIPVGLCYSFQVAIEAGDGTIKAFVLRTYDEYLNFNIKLVDEIRRQAVFGFDSVDRSWENEIARKKKMRVVTYYWFHNLGHDATFLENLYHDEFGKTRGKNRATFARNMRKPMKISTYISGVNVIFRDTLVLSQMSLRTWAETTNECPLEKEKDYDYIDVVLPTSELSEEQLKYMTVDVLIIVYCMWVERQQAGGITEIPLTQTGKLRKYLETHVTKVNKNWAENCGTISRSKSLDEYRELIALYSGGYTHCSNLWSGTCTKDIQDEEVYAYDIASSYPSSCFVKFPVCGYDECDVTEFDELQKQEPDSLDIKYRWWAKIRIKGIKSKLTWSYWSTSKMYNFNVEDMNKSNNFKVDNGRIHECDFEFDIYVDDYSWATFKEAYDIADYEVISLHKGVADYLCKELLESILEFYKNKSEFKGVAGKEAELVYQKQLLNAIYGLCCFKAITDEVWEDEDGWHKLTLEEGGAEMFYQQLLEQKELSPVMFELGICISSASRYRLWQMILHYDEKAIYVDTDSIKFFGTEEDIKFIDDWNNELAKKQKRVAEDCGLDYAKFSPLSKGKEKRLGIFDSEGRIHVKALRAKAYLTYNEEEGYNLTLAGLPKEAGKKIKSFDDFHDGVFWTTAESHKVICSYNEHQGKLRWHDKNGNDYISYEDYGVAMKPTTFSLDRSDEFKRFLAMLYMERLPLDSNDIGYMSPFLDIK